MVDGFDVIGLNRDIGQANHVACKPGNTKLDVGVCHTRFLLENRKCANHKIVKTSCLYRTFLEWELSLL